MSFMLLALSTAALGVVVPRQLARRRWVGGSPRLALMLGFATVTGAVLSLIGVALSLTQPLLARLGALPEVLHTCEHAAHVLRGHPAQVLIAGTGAVAFTLLITRLGWVAARQAMRARVAWHRHLLQLTLATGRRVPRGGLLVIEHPEPLAYTVPGARLIVASSGLSQLGDEQARAVLAHERAHLAGHHGAVLAIARWLAEAMPWLPAATYLNEVAPGLVELAADDQARRAHRPAALAAALVRIAGGGTVPPPLAALAAGSVVVQERVLRLTRTANPLRRRHRAAAIAAVTVIVATPLVLLAVPAGALGALHFCPFGLH